MGVNINYAIVTIIIRVCNERHGNFSFVAIKTKQDYALGERCFKIKIKYLNLSKISQDSVVGKICVPGFEPACVAFILNGRGEASVNFDVIVAIT